MGQAAHELEENGSHRHSREMDEVEANPTSGGASADENSHDSLPTRQALAARSVHQMPSKVRRHARIIGVATAKDHRL